jgi:hypothetical protein
MLRALGLVTLGIIGGASAVVLGSQASAQIPSTDELNARFVVSKPELAYVGRYAASFRFLKDKQTGDCYLGQVFSDRVLGEMIKTDDNACSGF